MLVRMEHFPSLAASLAMVILANPLSMRTEKNAVRLNFTSCPASETTIFETRLSISCKPSIFVVMVLNHPVGSMPKPPTADYSISTACNRSTSLAADPSITAYKELFPPRQRCCGNRSSTHSVGGTGSGFLQTARAYSVAREAVFNRVFARTSK